LPKRSCHSALALASTSLEFRPMVIAVLTFTSILSWRCREDRDDEGFRRLDDQLDAALGGSCVAVE
jgi:hypothetical protein